MTVELPKDAEGREIPLDTVVLFSRSGEAHNIVRWIYTTDFETWTESNIWRAIDENHRAIDPELMYLTTPDSWEKLEDDLGKIANNPGEVVCAYFGREISDCDGCKLESCECACSNAFLRDVIERIRELRGEN